MERETGTIAVLKALRYESNRCVTRCECDELPCPLISWLVLELRKSCPELKGASGTILAGELKELLNCMFYPYEPLGTEALTPAHLKRITAFLVSELQAARMQQYRLRNPEDELVNESAKEQRPRESNPDTESETLRDDKEALDELSELLLLLDMDPASQLSDVYAQVEPRLASLPEGPAQEPLLKTNLNSTQWSALNRINRALCEDYAARRQMMVKRFHVTLQSFAWGERGKERSARISSLPQFSVPLDSSVSVPLLLAARADQSRILPVTAGPSTAIHKVLMGSVPDRGGRPGEIEPPMPDFTRRSEGGGDQGRPKNAPKRREHSGKQKKKKKKQNKN